MITRKSKNILTVLCLTAILGILTGCDPLYRMVKCPSYVVCYLDVSVLDLQTVSQNPQSVVIAAGLGMTRYASLHSTGENKERYNQLCIKHNDLSYNQYRQIGGTLDIESVSYGDSDYTEIIVTADKDFDDMHPAGTKLSDIVRFMSWSPYKYILSGYSEYYHYDKSDVSQAFDTLMRKCTNEKYFDNATEATCYPIDKLIKELTPEDMILLGHDEAGFIGMLYFDKIPDEKGEYNITITIKTDDDRVLSDTIKLNF